MTFKVFNKRLYLLVVFVIACMPLCMQAQNININSTDTQMQTTPQPILILISADWCTYCSMQKIQLSKNKKFNKQNNTYYFVEFDANSQDEIIFNHQKYAFKPNGLNSGIHELAIALNGSEAVSFPTWILLDANYAILYKHSGVLNNSKMNDLLQLIDQYSEKLK